jgi:hypothetical protein
LIDSDKQRKKSGQISELLDLSAQVELRGVIPRLRRLIDPLVSVLQIENNRHEVYRSLPKMTISESDS